MEEKNCTPFTLALWDVYGFTFGYFFISEQMPPTQILWIISKL